MTKRCFLTTRGHESPLVQWAGWLKNTFGYAPACTTSARTRCGIRSPRTCSTAAPTCVTFRNCWATRVFRRRKSTHTSRWRSWLLFTTRLIQKRSHKRHKKHKRHKTGNREEQRSKEDRTPSPVYLLFCASCVFCAFCD